MNSINTVLRKLTFDDLHDWAEKTILKRGKGYVKRVDQFSRTEDNTPVAWVTGSKRYATSVRVNKAGVFEYFCTCPYSWGPCHTIGIVDFIGQDGLHQLSLIVVYKMGPAPKMIGTGNPLSIGVVAVLIGTGRRDLLDEISGRIIDIRGNDGGVAGLTDIDHLDRTGGTARVGRPRSSYWVVERDSSTSGSLSR